MDFSTKPNYKVGGRGNGSYSNPCSLESLAYFQWYLSQVKIAIGKLPPKQFHDEDNMTGISGSSLH
eukprot:5272476-Amphidinium_carterae.1